MDKSYSETVDYASEMDRIRRLLNLPIFGFPNPSTLCRSLIERRCGSGGSCWLPRLTSWITPVMWPLIRRSSPGYERPHTIYEELIDRWRHSK